MNILGFPSRVPVLAARRFSPGLVTSQRAAGPTRLDDGFEVARRGVVNLGGVSPPAAGSNTDFVSGLYRELLGREPDLPGLSSHLKGLETGLPRERLRQVFLDSAEYRARQQPTAPPPAAPPPAPPPARPSPIAGEPSLDAAWEKIKALRVPQSARACPNKHATLWVQAFVRGRSNNGWKVTEERMKALVDESGGSTKKYTKEMIYAVSARMHRPLSVEEARVIIFKVQRQYLSEVEALMRRYGQHPS